MNAPLVSFALAALAALAALVVLAGPSQAAVVPPGPPAQTTPAPEPATPSAAPEPTTPTTTPETGEAGDKKMALLAVPALANRTADDNNNKGAIRVEVLPPLLPKCGGDEECREWLGQHAACVDFWCACTDGAEYEQAFSKKCLLSKKDLGAGCKESGDCRVTNSYCKAGSCHCTAGFVFADDGLSCLPVATEADPSCSEARQCVILLQSPAGPAGPAVCLEGRCRCRYDHEQANGSCAPKRAAMVGEDRDDQGNTIDGARPKRDMGIATVGGGAIIGLMVKEFLTSNDSSLDSLGGLDAVTAEPEPVYIVFRNGTRVLSNLTSGEESKFRKWVRKQVESMERTVIKTARRGSAATTTAAPTGPTASAEESAERAGRRRREHGEGSATESPAEPPAETTTAAPAEAPAEAHAEAPTEAPTEAPAEAPAEAHAEAPTEAPAEPPAEAPAEAPAEPPAEAPAEAPADAPAEAPAEASTAAPAETPAATMVETAAPATSTAEASPPPPSTVAPTPASQSAETSPASSDHQMQGDQPPAPRAAGSATAPRGATCSAEVQCEDLVGGACIQGVCGCKEGFVPAVAANKCLPVQRAVAAPCEEAIQCSEALGELGRCQAGQCACADGASAAQGGQCTCASGEAFRKETARCEKPDPEKETEAPQAAQAPQAAKETQSKKGGAAPLQSSLTLGVLVATWAFARLVS